MIIKSKWKEAYLIESIAGDYAVTMDAASPLGQIKGKPSGQTPKQLLLASLCGCTMLDVVAMLKKHKQLPASFEVDANATMSEKQTPTVFTKVHLTFTLTGECIAERVIEAVNLSQTKYCSVTAMLSKAFPITYSVNLNGSEIHRGTAHF